MSETYNNACGFLTSFIWNNGFCVIGKRYGNFSLFLAKLNRFSHTTTFEKKKFRYHLSSPRAKIEFTPSQAVCEQYWFTVFFFKLTPWIERIDAAEHSTLSVEILIWKQQRQQKIPIKCISMFNDQHKCCCCLFFVLYVALRIYCTFMHPCVLLNNLFNGQSLVRWRRRKKNYCANLYSSRFV